MAVKRFQGNPPQKKTMTVREAGHLGGEKVRDLIHKGEEVEQQRNSRAA